MATLPTKRIPNLQNKYTNISLHHLHWSTPNKQLYNHYICSISQKRYQYKH